MTSIRHARTALLAGLVCASVTVAGCSSGGGGTGSSKTTGVTITVALATAPPPQASLDAFTKSTGITVKWSNTDWDSLQTKIAAAAILVCRLSQSVFDHLTVMPVLLVKASRDACGGGAVASATVIVTPVVLLDPVPPPPLEQPATVTLAQTRPASNAVLACRIEVMWVSPSHAGPPQCGNRVS